jgi:hypothetical protein
LINIFYVDLVAIRTGFTSYIDTAPMSRRTHEHRDLVSMNGALKRLAVSIGAKAHIVDAGDFAW